MVPLRDYGPHINAGTIFIPNTHPSGGRFASLSNISGLTLPGVMEESSMSEHVKCPSFPDRIRFWYETKRERRAGGRLERGIETGKHP